MKYILNALNVISSCNIMIIHKLLKRKKITSYYVITYKKTYDFIIEMKSELTFYLLNFSSK